MVQLSGVHVLVTGGASGLGESVVRRCVADGARVSIFDLSTEHGEKIVGELGQDKVAFFKVNIIDEKSVQEALEGGIAAFGPLRAVIQCAGIAAPCRVLSSRGVVHTLKAFEHVVNVNLIGTFNVLRLATALMAKSEPLEGGERGCFVHVASVAAFEGQIGQVGRTNRTQESASERALGIVNARRTQPLTSLFLSPSLPSLCLQSAYSASKGAVVAMTLPLARELGALGIRVNTIAPGIFATPMMAKLPAKAQESLSQQVPFPKRLGKPEEFADCCVNLVTNQYYNGTVVRLDGSIRMAAM